MAEAKKPDGLDEYIVADDLGPAAAPALPDLVLGDGRPATTDRMWYVGSSSGRREGPLPEAVVRERLAGGSLPPETLVWREGLSDWAPARTVPELFGACPGVPVLPPPMPHDWTAVQADVVQRVTTALSNPVFYRMAGWVAAGLAAFFLLASILLAFWHHTWFVEAGVFVILFFVCQATAVILDTLRRIESGGKGPDKE